MKIGFFGDSYCACRPVGGDQGFSWPYQVAKFLGYESFHFCLSGTHLFDAWLEIKKHIDEIDYIILTISDPYRFPNDFQIPTMSSGWDKYIARQNPKFGEKTLKEYGTFVELYYKFFSREFMRIGQKGLLQHIDDFIAKKKKPCLVIPGFELSMQGYEFKNAAFLETDLSTGIKYKSFNKDKPIANHLNEKENTILAQAVADFIKGKYKTGKISFKKYFEYLDN